MAVSLAGPEEKAQGHLPTALRRIFPIAFSIFICFVLCAVSLSIAEAQTFQNAHGGFSSATQFCAACHTTHEAAGYKLEKLSPESAVCFTCHNGTGSTYDVETEMNLNPGSNAMHPIIVSLSQNSGIYSYTPNTTAGIAPPGPYDCSQCHNPHGDVGNGILLRNAYNTSEYVTYTTSPDPYALCWTCHNSTSITTDQTLFPSHQFHIVGQRASCSACHFSPHAAPGAKLVKFNPAYVFPSASLGTGPSFTSTGANSGSCTLTCHGKDHANLGY